MKRSVQEIVELAVFGLIATLVGTGVLWVVGWLLGLVGTVMTWLAALIWSLVRFLVPVALVAGLAYALVRLLARSNAKVARSEPFVPAPPSPSLSPTPSASAEEPASDDSDSAADQAGAEVDAEPAGGADASKADGFPSDDSHDGGSIGGDRTADAPTAPDAGEGAGPLVDGVDGDANGDESDGDDGDGDGDHARREGGPS